MNSKIEFVRRIGPDPHANGAQTVALNGCPDLFELSSGDFAVIGIDITSEAQANTAGERRMWSGRENSAHSQEVAPRS